MKKNILTEQGNPATRRIDLMGTDEIVAAISHEDMKVARAVKKALPEIARAVDLIAGAFFKGGRLAYFGACLLYTSDAGSAFWTLPNVCRHFPFRTQWYRRLSPEETQPCATP